jgi:penicillin-binding protein 1A
LQAVVTSGTGTQAQLPGGRPAAGKTGTTDEHGDAWFIGFTPQLATAVWMGSPESVVPMQNVGGINVFGGTFPALVWHNYMAQAMDGLPVLGWAAPGPTPPSAFLAMPFENLRPTSPRSGGSRTTPPPAPAVPTVPPRAPAPAPTGGIVNGNGRGNGNGNGGGGGR